jgi:hypothetical protein
VTRRRRLLTGGDPVPLPCPVCGIGTPAVPFRPPGLLFPSPPRSARDP